MIEQASYQSKSIKLVAGILKRAEKAWFEDTYTANFLKNALGKLDEKIDLGLASEVALAYLALEDSGAVRVYLFVRYAADAPLGRGRSGDETGRRVRGFPSGTRIYSRAGGEGRGDASEQAR